MNSEIRGPKMDIGLNYTTTVGVALITILAHLVPRGSAQKIVTTSSIGRSSTGA